MQKERRNRKRIKADMMRSYYFKRKPYAVAQ